MPHHWACLFLQAAAHKHTTPEAALRRRLVVMGLSLTLGDLLPAAGVGSVRISALLGGEERLRLTPGSAWRGRRSHGLAVWVSGSLALTGPINYCNKS